MSNVSTMDLDEILAHIEKTSEIKPDEKNRFGEVFSPGPLIQEMLDCLPTTIWADPTKTWLDPAAGSGNFFMLVFPRLMKGLAKSIPNKEKRQRHILGNMLFMVELNKINTKILRNVFGPRANVCQADFLEQKKKWTTAFHGKTAFDIILGNPPFQEDAHVGEKGYKYIRTGLRKLYERFIEESISIVPENGQILFVSPDNIFTGNINPTYREILGKTDVHHIDFRHIQERYFPSIQQDMCFFLLSRKSQTEPRLYKTTICPFGQKSWQVFLKDRPINPVREWTPKTERLINKYVSNQKNEAQYYRGTSPSDYKGGKYEVIYSEDKFLRTNNIDLAKGMGIPKIVLFETNPQSEGIFDEKGQYGVGPHTFYIPIKSTTQGKRWMKFFKSDDYKRLVQITTTSYYLKTSLILHLHLVDTSVHRRRSTARKQ